MTRRELLLRLLGLAACGVLPASLVHAATTEGGSPTNGQPFSPDWLRETAQRLAREPYIPLTDTRPPWLVAVDYDLNPAIGYRK